MAKEEEDIDAIFEEVNNIFHHDEVYKLYYIFTKYVKIKKTKFGFHFENCFFVTLLYKMGLEEKPKESKNAKKKKKQQAKKQTQEKDENDSKDGT